MFFSIIIPSYNREHILPKAIDSVLQQTFSDFELIVVDNGSTDNTRQLIETYSHQDNRIRYFWQENSGSPAGSRNTGIQNAKGEWIAFLDSDDWWFQNKLEEVHKTIQTDKTNSYVAISHWEDKYVNNHPYSTLRHGSEKENNLYEKLLFEGNLFSTSAMTVKADILRELGGFNPRKDYFIVEDYDLWMRIAQKGPIFSIKKSLGVFSINNSNMSGNIELTHKNLKQLIHDHIEKLVLSQEDKDTCKRIHFARIDYYQGRSYQLEGQFDKAITLLWSSIQRHPWVLKKWLSFALSVLRIAR